ncbi:DUF1161 domain-containing protein [Azohydromonas aeria]|uniref:DUF1161 domain-containing protein n=1 Tax=Azohydromonas aeria TaxID=2590212 RepID=UPI001E5B7EB0|nr:DUF1161 domain-containing protein [Azohydromonas aeria]
MLKPSLITLALLLPACMAARASNCEPIQAEIEAKFRAGGVERFTLSTVDAEAEVPGRVVGRCDQGRRKIVYLPGTDAPGAATAPAAPRATAPAPRRREVITECRDGSIVVNGECPRQADPAFQR